jgi:hypothetical protein
MLKSLFGPRRKGAGRGRRSKYAPAASDVGFRRFLPVTWQHWFGFTLFSLVGVAVFAEMIRAVIEERGADPIAAFGVLCLVLFVVYRFAVTRVTDNPEGSGPT